MRKIYLILVPALLLAAGCGQDHTAHRQAEVATRGVDVMPFDLERTTHIFEKRDTGGLQRVVSDDQDSEQIRLVQEHLAQIAEQFSRGDFHGPSHIHGEQMPGLHALVMGHERLRIIYTAIPEGGEILYTTDDPALIEALHAWFDAQVSDHGRHAEHGMH